MADAAEEQQKQQQEQPRPAKKSVRMSQTVEEHQQERRENLGQNEAQPVIANHKAKRLLVAMDESEESMRALRYALETVVQPGDRVAVMHSQPLPQSYAGPGGPGFYITPDLVAATKKHQEHITDTVLAKASKVCEEAKVKAELVTASGDPRDSICEAVDKIQADLLVMGSRGHGAIKRTFLGSVSDYCAHNAKCPVLIVRK